MSFKWEKMAKIYHERQEQVEHRLLTKSIPMLVDGAYPYHTGAWLSFHEMFRREFLGYFQTR